MTASWYPAIEVLKTTSPRPMPSAMAAKVPVEGGAVLEEEVTLGQATAPSAKLRSR